MGFCQVWKGGGSAEAETTIASFQASQGTSLPGWESWHHHCVGRDGERKEHSNPTGGYWLFSSDWFFVNRFLYHLCVWHLLSLPQLLITWWEPKPDADRSRNLQLQRIISIWVQLQISGSTSQNSYMVRIHSCFLCGLDVSILQRLGGQRVDEWLPVHNLDELQPRWNAHFSAPVVTMQVQKSSYPNWWSYLKHLKVFVAGLVVSLTRHAYGTSYADL